MAGNDTQPWGSTPEGVGFGLRSRPEPAGAAVAQLIAETAHQVFGELVEHADFFEEEPRESRLITPGIEAVREHIRDATGAIIEQLDTLDPRRQHRLIPRANLESAGDEYYRLMVTRSPELSGLQRQLNELIVPVSAFFSELAVGLFLQRQTERRGNRPDATISVRAGEFTLYGALAVQHMLRDQRAQARRDVAS